MVEKEVANLTDRKIIIKGREAIAISDSNKAIKLLNKDNFLVEFIYKNFDAIRDNTENKVILEICYQFYKDSKTFTKNRKELLNFILNHTLNWNYILQELENVAK